MPVSSTSIFEMAAKLADSALRKSLKPVLLLDQGGRLAEISARRNSLERDLRALISQVFRMSFSQKDRLENVVSKVSPYRRPALSAYSFADILAVGESPL